MPFAYKDVIEKLTYGSNCLPSICFKTLEELKKKIADKEICIPLTKIGNNMVAVFIDSEGNHIEVYTRKKE